LDVEALRDLGRRLEEARREKGLSLADVSRRLKIRLSVIEGLERGDLSGVPKGPYVVGFFRNYAKMLGLDESSVERFKEALGDWVLPPHEEVREKVERYGKDARSFSRSGGGWAFLLLLLFVGGVAVFFWQHRMILSKLPQPGSGSQPQATASVVAPQASEPASPEVSSPQQAAPSSPAREPSAVEPNPISSPEVVSEEVEVAPVAARPQEELPSTVRLRLELTGRCWVRVLDGSKVLFMGTLGPGDVREFEGRELVVRYGNAPAVRVYLDGRALGAPRTETGIGEFRYLPGGRVERIG